MRPARFMRQGDMKRYREIKKGQNVSSKYDSSKPRRMQLSSGYNCAKCGTPFNIPLNPDWSDPMFVAAMEQEHALLKAMLIDMRKDLLELAGECLQAGVKPSVLKRADEVRELLNDLLKRFGTDS